MNYISNILKSAATYRLFAVMCLIVSLFFVNDSIAQNTKISMAITEFQAGNLDSSKVYIDQAAIHDETKSDAKTWYYRGFIYKKIYTTNEAEDKLSKSREISLSSFETFFQLDTVSEITESAIKTVKYLSSTLYNDAAGLLNEGKYEAALSNFDKYKKAMNMIEPEFDATSYETQFYLVLGQQYNRLYEDNRVQNKPFFEKTKQAYLHVIALDSNNTSANYNYALLYYNDAVDIIKNLDYDMDLIDLTMIQDDVVEMFRKSLPYMQKALELDPCRKATYTGLSGIFFSLGNMDMSKKVQEQLDHLKAPVEYPTYNGEITEESWINYMPMCAMKPAYFIKVVKGTDGAFYRADQKKYILIYGGHYVEKK